MHAFCIKESKDEVKSYYRALHASPLSQQSRNQDSPLPLEFFWLHSALIFSQGLWVLWELQHQKDAPKLHFHGPKQTQLLQHSLQLVGLVPTMRIVSQIILLNIPRVTSEYPIMKNLHCTLSIFVVPHSYLECPKKSVQSLKIMFYFRKKICTCPM